MPLCMLASYNVMPPCPALPNPTPSYPTKGKVNMPLSYVGESAVVGVLQGHAIVLEHHAVVD